MTISAAVLPLEQQPRQVCTAPPRSQSKEGLGLVKPDTPLPSPPYNTSTVWS